MSAQIDAVNEALMALNRARAAQEWPGDNNSANVLIDNLVNAAHDLVEHSTKIAKQRDEAVSGLEEVATVVQCATREANR